METLVCEGGGPLLHQCVDGTPRPLSASKIGEGERISNPPAATVSQTLRQVVIRNQPARRLVRA